MLKQSLSKKSYEDINYGLRPAKCVERKMLCEAFRRLSPFGDIRKYRYIGFGSPYFVDFSLFHRVLRIENMICIEKNEDDTKRFEFNKPFSCIDMKYGESNEELPKLKWGPRTIIWLDYDSTLDNSILQDIKLAVSSLKIGSMVVITVDASIRDELGNKSTKNLLDQLKMNVGEKNVPLDITENNLNGWNIAKIFKRIIDNEIKDTLKAINGGRSKGNELIYSQLFNFHYADSTNMLSVGGIIYNEGTTGKFNKCNFTDLFYIKEGEGPFLIEIPKLTFREIKFLDKFLPSKFSKTPNYIPYQDKRVYKDIYPYFPLFAETEIN